MKKINNKILLFLIFPIAIISKLFQYKMLSAKYFIDANKILYIMNGWTDLYGKSYHQTASFFKAINIFNLQSLQQWSIFLTIIFNIIFFIILSKYKNLKVTDYIFIYVSMILLDIFAFNLSKEIIQLLFFLIIFLILKSSVKEKNKIFLSCLIMLIETLTFRNYYILVILAFIISYYYLLKIKKNNKSKLKYILLTILTFLFCIYLSQFITPYWYKFLLELRNNYENNLFDANTLIQNIINVKNPSMNYILNYIVNGFRIIFPIELVFKSIKYSPFIVYQFVFIYYIFRAIKNINKDNIIATALILGYTMTSITFEPDFGSVIRHESVLFPFLILLNYEFENKSKNLAGEIE